jgi:hypothetical protein
MLRQLTLDEVGYISGGTGGGGGIGVDLNIDVVELIRLAMELWNAPTDEDTVHSLYNPHDGNGFTSHEGRWARNYDSENGVWTLFYDTDGDLLYDEMYRKDAMGDWWRSTDGETWKRYLTEATGYQTMATVNG